MSSIFTSSTTEGISRAFVLASCKRIRLHPNLALPYVVFLLFSDFPGMCFASTRCATVEPTKTWELTPFCGRSTCVQNDETSAKLLELVEDCGPLPLANDKCKLDTEKTNKTAPFPYCCPIFTCESGVKLEYPEIPKEETKKE
ncbi:PREDICTED: uncharacterized protein LOC108974299 [Bactrocera latifrons]|uniref:uncharacterized protein LOC108974299 n=1 Tax=Bactrocera latifrons TaxID=174628 RepID=UPI0008DE8F0B|nr:PREDICTED: uncharacterized protein LOC108974299 [Bactrocera latifrons]